MTVSEKFAAGIAAATLATAVLAGCHYIDDDRVPVAPVMISFPTVAQWTTYGVTGALDYEYFILEKRIPSGYPYTAISATGYGGILLVSNTMGEPKAFDLSCPVECSRDVRVEIDKSTMLAVCPKCGSTYDVFSLNGHPTSGTAAERGYGLRPYYAGPGRDGTYMLISF